MKRQSEIPGTERANSIPELDSAAESFKRSSKRRKKAQDDELAAREFLENLMRHHGLKTYEDREHTPPLVVKLAVTEKVTVEEISDTDDESEDGEGEDAAPAHLKKLDAKAAKKATPEA